MSQTITVEFVRPWRNYRRGQRITPPAGQAREMMKRGIVVEVQTAPTPARTGQTVTMTPPVSIDVDIVDEGPKSGKKQRKVSA